MVDPMAKILDIEAMSFGYDEKVIFEDFSLSISQGEAVILLGPSGVGKSTLLRLLAGLDKPTKGRIDYAKIDHLKTRLVFQEPRLFPWLSVRGNLHFALRAAEVPAAQWAERIENLLQEVGLLTEIDSSIQSLSVGMAQRIALVRALCCRPQLLLLDEPFSALDPKRRRQLQDDLLGLISQTESAVVMVTHDIEEAIRIGQRIVVLGGQPARIVDMIDQIEDSPAVQERLNQLLLS